MTDCRQLVDQGAALLVRLCPDCGAFAAPGDTDPCPCVVALLDELAAAPLSTCPPAWRAYRERC